MTTNIIVVLGCSRGIVSDQHDDSVVWKIDPHGHLTSRLNLALLTWSSLSTENKIIVCSGGKSKTRYVSESYLMKEWLVDKGVPAHRIFEESNSKSTIQNCVFTYRSLGKWFSTKPMLHRFDLYSALIPVNVNDITIHLVTSDYHVKRSRQIFEFFLNSDSNLSISPYTKANVVTYSAITRNKEDRKECFEREENILKNVPQQLANAERDARRKVCA